MELEQTDRLIPTTEEKNSQKKVDITGAANADMNTAAAQTHMDKFHAAQGHGFAAEQANHLYDILSGKDAAIVGGDNVKNGADRLVNGIKIQTKYCQSASSSVAAAFDGGRYRYLNPDGSFMQLEVPPEQYEKAVELMARRIEKGQVPGVTNPADAREIIRKGHFTYEQAKNIAKFGTVESLAFDAVTGAIISTSAFGITAVLTLAKSLWDGDTPEVAIENAVYSGLQIGGASFANTLITSQLMRTGMSKALTVPTESVIKLIGPKTSAMIANSLQSGANIYGAAAMNNVAKLLRGNIVTAATMTVVLSAKDISNVFRGRISGKQLFKSIAATAGGMTGGTAGFVAGKFILNLVAPGAGEIAAITVSLIGATAGGAMGSTAANTIIGQFMEDDAVALVRIIEDKFCQLAQEYMLSQEEVSIILDDLSISLKGEKLLDMYASKDHTAFADNLVRSQIERLVRGRCRIYLPTEAEFIQGFSQLLGGAQSGARIFAGNAAQTIDPVEIGQALTGREISSHSAKKAWYATKQMNLAQVQAEGRIEKVTTDERKFKEEMTAIHGERKILKDELFDLLGGTEE